MNKKASKKFNIGTVFDILAYGIMAIVFSVLQTTLIPRFQIFDAYIDLLIGVICFLGIYRGENTAAVFGLFAGLCVDGLGNIGISLLPLFYVFGGYICGNVGKIARDNAKFTAYLISIPIFTLARCAITFVSCLLKNYKSIDFVRFFLYTTLPEYISTLVVCIIVFFVLKIVELPLNHIRKRGGLD